jgi:hypothetical protein
LSSQASRLQALWTVPSLQLQSYPFPSCTHAPFWQPWPAGQLPVWHGLPQPSSAPQALPSQLGVQPHLPASPPPPHVWGATQATHAAPPVPQAASVGGATHVPLPQQPFGQLAPAQAQAPPMQSSPGRQQAPPQ